MKSVNLVGKTKQVSIGGVNPIAVNVNIGVSSNNQDAFDAEIEKIERLRNLEMSPDLMMDLSLNVSNGYLYDEIATRIGCPIGIIPHYFCIDKSKKINKDKLIDEMHKAAISGVSWFVIHLTPDIEKIEKAISTRKIPLSSRSATIIIEDMISRNAKRSIYWEVLDEVIQIVKKYSIVLSLGSAFRSPDTNCALDEVHKMELKKYLELIKMITNEGVSVITEGLGHCSPEKIDEFIKYINALNVPCMPLGPLFTDDFDKDDHIINAIGFYTGIIKGANFSIINSITSSEHSGGIPDCKSIIEGYLCARSTAELCNNYLKNNNTKHKKNHCLNVHKGSKGCSRCQDVCPIMFCNENESKIKNWVNMNK